jgi:Flp pilus assembly pilin Flp
MQFFRLAITKWAIWKDQRGQDIIEYSLLAGFLAVLAAASIPTAISAVANALHAIVTDLNNVANNLVG